MLVFLNMWPGLWIILILSMLLRDETYTGIIELQGKPWPFAQWKFYIAFSMFRGASIFAGVYSRWIMVYLEEYSLYCSVDNL